MFTASDYIPANELSFRHKRCRHLLETLCPQAGGLMVFGRIAIYYLTGTMASGVFWLPKDGAPLLMLRKGLERAAMEAPTIRTVHYRSYSDIPRLAEEHTTPLSPVIAAEQAVLPWALADMLKSRLTSISFISADALLAQVRAIKTPWELEKMRIAGKQHALAMEDVLPQKIHHGQSELAIAHEISSSYFTLGSCGICRMSTFGEEMYVGEVSVGENGNYSTVYNGPLGCKGMHPAAPFLGNKDVIWHKNTLLALDAGFNYEGYNSDKTSLYFSGKPQDIPPVARKAQDVCMRIETAVANAMKPGAIPAELYTMALAMAKEANFTHEFMGIGGNTVPFIGHGIGLCIDEWPVLAKQFTEPLVAGMTMAVEPKIGLPGVGMVGSENTYEITETGAVSLSGSPSDIMCIDN